MILAILNQLSLAPDSEVRKMEYTEASIKLSGVDGVPLHMQALFPKNINLASQALLFLHGLGSHSGQVMTVMKQLSAQRGLCLFAPDMRGHGLSGHRGVIESASLAVADINVCMDYVLKNYGHLPIFLGAESMGTLFALAYAAQPDPHLAGLIIASPGLMLHPYQLLHASSFFDIMHLLLNPTQPTLSVVDWRLEAGGGSPEFIDNFRNDPLTLKKVSLSYLAATLSLMLGWEWRFARHIFIPVIILFGKQDKIVHSLGAKYLFDSIASSNKKLVGLNQQGHHFLWGSGSNLAYATLTDWLTKQPAALAPPCPCF